MSIRYWDDAGNLLSINQLPFKNVEMLELSLGFTTPDSFASAELLVQKAKGKSSFWVDDIQVMAQQGGEVPRGF